MTFNLREKRLLHARKIILFSGKDWKEREKKLKYARGTMKAILRDDNCFKENFYKNVCAHVGEEMIEG